MASPRALPILLTVAFAAACGSTSTAPTVSASDDDAGARHDGSIVVDGPCLITIDTPPILGRNHLGIGTPIAYDSNPPSSGPHYPIWAAYQAYTTPVDPRYLVHDLEHGGVVFFYSCNDGGDCAGRAAALQVASDSLPSDPFCSAAVRVRTVITPDPQLDVPIAAAAWGWTYRAACIDLPSLEDFARQHYGNGPELNNCSDGTNQF